MKQPMAAVLEIEVGLGPQVLPQWQSSEKSRKEEKATQVPRIVEIKVQGQGGFNVLRAT